MDNVDIHVSPITSTAQHRCGLLLQTEWRGRSLCVSVTTIIPAKTAEPIRMPHGRQAQRTTY